MFGFSVFNHYNRVRANFAARLDEEQDAEWYDSEDREYMTGLIWAPLQSYTQLILG